MLVRSLSLLFVLTSSFVLQADDPKPIVTPQVRNLTGVAVRLVRSPKGPYESLLIRHGEAVFQANFPKEHSDLVAGAVQAGDSLEIVAETEESKGYWLVVKLKEVKVAGKSLVIPPKPMAKEATTASEPKKEPAPEATIEGVVALVSYSKHGEANGVILKDGALLHLNPHGYAAIKPAIGDKISATGAVVALASGEKVMEHPRLVNGKPAPEKPAKVEPAKVETK